MWKLDRASVSEWICFKESCLSETPAAPNGLFSELLNRLLSGFVNNLRGRQRSRLSPSFLRFSSLRCLNLCGSERHLNTCTTGGGTSKSMFFLSFHWNGTHRLLWPSRDSTYNVFFTNTTILICFSWSPCQLCGSRRCHWSSSVWVTQWWKPHKKKA